jgi:NAD(P)-dependent dehydrogenase (short-subunit alcohol dehydrogenase family)
MGILDGKVAIVTGSGHGIGRGEALELAAQGAKVVINDLGGSSIGEGADKRPAEETVAVIKARGGEAVANYDDVADFGGAENLIATAYEAFGGHDILINNAGIIRDKMIVSMSRCGRPWSTRCRRPGCRATRDRPITGRPRGGSPP